MGVDFAVYLTSVFPSVKKLILLDGDYLNLDKICNLEEEMGNALSYLEQTFYSSIEEAISLEHDEARYWPENCAKAVKTNLIFDEKAQVWKLRISQQIVTNLLTLRRLVYGRLHKLSDRQIYLFLSKVNLIRIGKFRLYKDCLIMFGWQRLKIADTIFMETILWGWLRW